MFDPNNNTANLDFDRNEDTKTEANAEEKKPKPPGSVMTRPKNGERPENLKWDRFRPSRARLSVSPGY